MRSAVSAALRAAKADAHTPTFYATSDITTLDVKVEMVPHRDYSADLLTPADLHRAIDMERSALAVASVAVSGDHMVGSDHANLSLGILVGCSSKPEYQLVVDNMPLSDLPLIVAALQKLYDNAVRDGVLSIKDGL